MTLKLRWQPASQCWELFDTHIILRGDFLQYSMLLPPSFDAPHTRYFSQQLNSY